MTPPPSNNSPEPSPVPTLDATEAPRSGPQTRASDLDVSDAGVQTAAVSPDRVAASGRYVLTAFHARGGMGEVWRCQDATIGREVALKRLVSDRITARERFLCEAQVTGQLQHPGIVPVHDLGFDDSGRPYYVMTFVQGRTLTSAIEDFYSAQGGAAQRQIDRVRLLKVFLDLCNAVAYAHSRGIIHRDLKPDNVMLGPFGETVLLDWGLAKSNDRSEIPGPLPPSAPPSISGQSVHTEDGSIMGSPLYMPPEMAQGHIVDADQRTDVYLLGSTLYQILTGRPPRQGGSRDEILEMARTTAPIPPRKIQVGTPRALEAICLKAMASDKSRRYESVMQLGDDIQRFLAGEPVSAYREPAPARLWRWAKRHRRLIGRSAAVFAMIGCATAAITLYRDAARVKAREQARQQVQRVRYLADEARFYAAGVDAPGEVAPYYDVGRSEKSANAALAMSSAWGPALNALPLDDQREALRRELSDLSLRLAQLQLARPSAATATAETIALLDRADALAPSRLSHQLRAQAYRVDGRDADAAAQAKLAAGDDNTRSARERFLDAESIRLQTALQPTLILNDVDARRNAVKAIARAADLYQASLRQDPTDYWARFQLGRCYLELARFREAAEALSTCIALRPQSPWGYSARGLSLALLRRFDDAKLDFDRAIELDPQCVAPRLNRGIMYRLQGRPRDAAAEFDALLALPNPPPEAAIYRGQLLLIAGDPAGALKLFGRFSTAPICLMRADAHLRLGQSAEARRDLDALLPPGDGESAAAAAHRGHLLRCLAANLPQKDQKAALDLAAE